MHEGRNGRVRGSPAQARMRLATWGLFLAASVGGPLVHSASAERRPLPPLTRIRLFNGTGTHRPQTVEVSVTRLNLPAQPIPDAQLSGDLRPGGIFQLTAPTDLNDVVEVRMILRFLDSGGLPAENDLTLTIPTAGTTGNPSLAGDSVVAADFIWVNGNDSVMLKGRVLYRTDTLSSDETTTGYRSTMHVRYGDSLARGIGPQAVQVSAIRPVLTDVGVYNGSGRPMVEGLVLGPVAQFQVGLPPLKDLRLIQTASGPSVEVFEMVRPPVVGAVRLLASGTLFAPIPPPDASEPVSWDIPLGTSPLPAGGEFVCVEMLVGVDGQATNLAKTAFHTIYYDPTAFPRWKYGRSQP
jgi:hypothetical protein